MPEKKFHFLATQVGSLPHLDPRRACAVIFNHFPEIPAWPQLPRRSFLESMYTQYSEGLPGVVIDEKARQIYFQREQAQAELENYYEKLLNSDFDYFKISPAYAQGLYTFLDELPKKKSPALKFIKGQITGPVSFALSVCDQEKKALLYDEILYEALIKGLCLKARWLARKMRSAFAKVIIFIDEPYLGSLGSGFINLPAEKVIFAINEVAQALHAEEVLVGMHCCANTDWALLLSSEIDILNFDAYNFTSEMLLYAGELKKFFESGKILAWGIVPSAKEQAYDSVEALEKRIKAAIKVLINKGVEKKLVLAQSLLTPSCGLGTLSEKLAEQILETTSRLSGILQTHKF
jgi:methionine synthase II (cobalamin-independent)